MLGNWNINEEMEVCTLPKEVQAAFDKWNILGVKYEPVLYAGTQVVKGINYMFICKTTLVTPAQTVGLAQVILNEFQGEVMTIAINRLI